MSDPRPPRRRLRWLARWFVRVLLLLLIVGLTAYLTRRSWVEPFAIGRIEAALAESLDGTVHIGSIDGNWLDTFVLTDVEVHDSRWLEVERGRFEIAISPWAAAQRDWLAVVTGARVTAETLRVRIPEPSDRDNAPSDDTSLIPDFVWTTLDRIAPEGVRVRVADCEVASEHGARRGRLDVALQPAAERRRLDAFFGGVEINGFATRDGRARLDLHTGRPGAILRAFGIANELSGGDGELSLRLRRDGEVRANLDLHDIQLGKQGQVEAVADVTLHPGERWLAEDIAIRVPGASVIASGVSIADPRLTADILPTLRGDLDVRIEDCSRFQPLIPDGVSPWLPVSGWFDGDFADNELVVSSGSFVWAEGVSLRIASGRIPFAAGGDETDASLTLEVRLPRTRRFDLTDTLPLELAGFARATLTGSVEELAVHTELDLARGSIGETSWGSLRGTVDMAPDRSMQFDLKSTGTRSRQHPLDLTPVALTANGSLSLDPLHVRGDVDAHEEARDDRAPSEVVASVDYRDGVVDVPQIAIGGPLQLSGKATVDTKAGTIDVDAPALEVDLAAVGSLFGIELPPATARGSALVRGPWGNPAATIRLDGDLPSAISHLPSGVWLPEYGAPPAGPLTVTLHATRAGDAVHIERFDARLEDALQCSGSGDLPIAWDGSELSRFTSERALAGSIDLRFDETAAENMRGVESHLEFDWNADELALPSIAVGAKVAAIDRQFLRGDVRVPGLTRALIGDTSIDEVRVTGELRGDPIDLVSIPESLRPLPILEGRVDFDAKLDGPLSMPIESARLRLREGRCKLPGAVPTIEDLEFAAEFGPSKATIQTARGTLGAGEFALLGTADYDGYANLADAELNLRFEATDALVLRRTGLKLRTNAELTITGSRTNRIDVRGDVDLPSGKFNRRISLVPDFRSKGAGATQGLPLPRIPDPLGSLIHWDIGISTSEPLELALHVVEAPVRVGARLRGTGAAPFFDGTASTLDGTVRLPAMGMTVTQAVLTFGDERPDFPTVFAIARGRRLGVDVQAAIEGPIDNVEITLSSTPALSQEEIMVLITTGRLPDELRERGLRSQAQLVGAYLANELLDFYLGSDSTDRDETLLDRFTFESGREISSNGVETLTAEFDLRRGFYLQVEQDLYEDFNMGILYRFRF